MSRAITRTVIVLLCILVTSAGHSNTIHVKQDGSGDYSSIEMAALDALAGDTVLVWPGHYPGQYIEYDISIFRPIHLISRDGPTVTIIEQSIEIAAVGGDCSVIGFTITVAVGHLCDAGICNYNSRTLIKNNVIKNNSGINGGGIVVYGFPSPTIEHNVIDENSAFNGSAIIVRDSSPVIRFNTIINNVSFDYDGGQIAVLGESSCPVISNNIISRNVISFGGGSGIFCYSDCPPGNLTVTCNNLWNNAPPGNYVGIPDLTGVDGNISDDPLFCGTIGSGNYYLQTASPCAEQNVPGCCNSERIGCYSVKCEVGTEEESWGKIKTFFKK